MRNVKLLKELERELQSELLELSKLRENVNKSIIKLPEGAIHTGMLKGKYPQYIFVNEETKTNNSRGKYLKKDEIETARLYIQNAYSKDVLDAVEQRINEIKKTIVNLPSTDIGACYDRLPTAKKLLVEPFILTDDQFLEQWYAQHPGNQNKFPYEFKYETENGEVVRSKTEKLIADKFLLNKIPYVYEPCLSFKKGETVFPDFAMLNCHTRETFYLEHFGKMDDPDYCKKALEKVDMYAENRFYWGERLVITFESSKKAINMKQIDDIIERFLI